MCCNYHRPQETPYRDYEAERKARLVRELGYARELLRPAERTVTFGVSWSPSPTSTPEAQPVPAPERELTPA